MKYNIALPALLLLITVNLCAQQQKRIPKLTKHERIWVAAYDDTTKALASLFLSKRNQYRKEQETGYYVLGASVVVLGTGLMLSSRDTNTGASSPEDQDMDMSFLPMLLGFSGMICSGLTLGGHAVTMHPYTVKKYNRLLTQYKAGEPIPKFYTKRMARYLH